MAVFNPQTPSEGLFDQRDWGQTPVSAPVDRSLGELFQGVGDLVGQATFTADQAIKQNIEAAVYQGVDQIRAEFGVEDALIPATDISSGRQPLPAEIERAGQNIQALQEAVAQGRLSEAHYYARLENLVRQVRARYPTYRQEIDQTVSRITGITPANALRAQLMEEARSLAAGTGSAEQKFVSYMEANQQYLPPNAWEGYQTGQYNELYIRSYVTERRQEEAGIANRRARLALEADEHTLDKRDALSAARREIRDSGDRILSDATTVLGRGFQDFRTALTRANADGNYSAEEQAQIRQMFGQIKANYALHIDNVLSQPWVEGGESYNTVLDSTELSELRSEALRTFDVYEKALIDQNFGLLLAKAALIDAKKKDNLANFYLADERLGGAFGRLEAFSEIAGPTLADYLLMHNKEILNSEIFSLNNDNLAWMGTQGEALVKQLEKLEAHEVADPAAYRDLISRTTDALSSTDISDTALSNFVRAVFGTENYDVFSKFNQEERLELFSELTKPAVTERIKKAGPEVQEVYKAWAKDRFTTLFRQEADTIQEGITSQDTYTITFNPTSGRFMYQPTGRNFGITDALNLDAYMNSYQARKAVQAVDRMNKAIEVMKPVLAIDGQNVTDQLIYLFASQGINPSAPRQPDFWSALGSAVASAVGDKWTQMRDEAIEYRRQREERASRQQSSSTTPTNFDTLVAAVEQVESGGNENAVSSAGARGPMQVMRRTGEDPGYGVTPMRDDSPEENRRFGRDYLQAMLKNYNSEVLALAAYNAGPGNVNKWIREFGDPRTGEISEEEWRQQIPFKETRDYVVKVLNQAG